MSVYRAELRTNNSVESSNAALKRAVGTHTAVWKLVCRNILENSILPSQDALDSDVVAELLKLGISSSQNLFCLAERGDRLPYSCERCSTYSIEAE